MKAEVSPSVIKRELEYCKVRLSIHGINVNSKAIRGNSRKMEYNGVRALIVYILRKKKYSFAKIGTILNRDHTTARHLLMHDKFKHGRYKNFEQLKQNLDAPQSIEEIQIQIDFHKEAIKNLRKMLCK